MTALVLLACLLAGGGRGAVTSSSNPSSPSSTPTLGQAAAHHNINIRVGAAADSPYLSDNNYAAILGSEFSQLQAENEMKFSIIHPLSNGYHFSGGDALTSFAQAHNKIGRAHV